LDISEVGQLAKKIKANVKKVIIGKDEVIDMMIIAMFCEGHVLLEDVPGSGKTMLAKTLAKSIDGNFKRIQLTPDLMPTDITGVNYFNMKTAQFEFIKGPVFANVLIADEINRATPKTQSGLLESMEEKQATIDGKTYQLDRPFIVIATQNPIDTQGVFPLPEAQIDRFLMKLNMEYPNHEDTIGVLKTHISEQVLEHTESVTTLAQVVEAADAVNSVQVHDDLIEYVVDIIEATRKSNDVMLGVSSRGGLALLKAAKAAAAVAGRDYVIPDDIKAVAVYVCAHRVIMKSSLQIKKDAAVLFIRTLLEQITVPTEEQLQNNKQ